MSSSQQDLESKGKALRENLAPLFLVTRRGHGKDTGCHLLVIKRKRLVRAGSNALQAEHTCGAINYRERDQGDCRNRADLRTGATLLTAFFIREEWGRG